jgi:hypothetical protein
MEFTVDSHRIQGQESAREYLMCRIIWLAGVGPCV